MLAQVARRLLGALPNLFGIVLITFLLTRALPGDPAAFFAGPAGTQEAVAEVPSHEAARAGLEQLLARPDLRQRVARLLEPLYLDDASWEKLIGVLGAQREGHKPAVVSEQL